MSQARKSEVPNLLERDPYRFKVLHGKLVLSIRSASDGQAEFKTRYIIGCHRNGYKIIMAHKGNTLQPQSSQTLFALAALFDFTMCERFMHGRPTSSHLSRLLVTSSLAIQSMNLNSKCHSAYDYLSRYMVYTNLGIFYTLPYTYITAWILN